MKIRSCFNQNPNHRGQTLHIPFTENSGHLFAVLAGMRAAPMYVNVTEKTTDDLYERMVSERKSPESFSIHHQCMKSVCVLCVASNQNNNKTFPQKCYAHRLSIATI